MFWEQIHWFWMLYDPAKDYIFWTSFRHHFWTIANGYSMYTHGSSPYWLYVYIGWRGRAVLCIVSVLALSECGFESRPGRSRCSCPWARHLIIIASSFGWDVKLYCRSRVLCNARKQNQDTYHEREWACPGVSGFAPWAGSICARYQYSVLLLLLLQWRVLYFNRLKTMDDNRWPKVLFNAIFNHRK